MLRVSILGSKIRLYIFVSFCDVGELSQNGMGQKIGLTI